MTELSTQHKTRVVIVGGGFGGLSTAKGLADAPFNVTLIDRNNHHLFQPLLYQVATAGLSPADIASPIRGILGGQRNVKIMLAEVSGVDVTRKEVIADGRRIGYDYLVLATGARHAYFGHNDWAAFAPGLKTIDDATYLRRRILLAFERAENETDVDERRRLMTFVVVGGGPTGVEMAGAIAELAKRALASDFQSIDPQCASIVLIEGAQRLLTPFDPSLSHAARRSLNQLGVDVRLGAAVTDCSCEGVRLGDEFIPTRTIIWAAGVMASPAGRWLGAESTAPAGLRFAPIFRYRVIPMCLSSATPRRLQALDGAMLPGVAPVAKQQGQYVARALIARYQGRTAAAFRYRDFGSLATIGRSRAVAQFGKLRLSGFPAWVLWSGAHVYFLIGFRNRFVVALNWAWSYITFQRGSRLITGLYARVEDMRQAPRSELRSKAS